MKIIIFHVFYRMVKYIHSILFLGAILAIGLVLSGYKENFELMPDKFPNRLLLADTYAVKQNPGLSNKGDHQYLIDPVEFSGGFDQASNNVKLWETPCDGSTFPPRMCGGLYEKKTVEKETSCLPGFGCRRVGFFCSKLN